MITTLHDVVSGMLAREVSRGHSDQQSENGSDWENIGDHMQEARPEQPLLSSREAIKIKAQCVNGGTCEWKSMTIDPNITSYDSLFLLLKRAFEIPCDFDISYLLPKSAGNSSRPDVYLSLSSDWDLDAAFHTASFPCLVLKVLPFRKGDVSDWDVLDSTDVPAVQDIKSTNAQLPIGLSLRHDFVRTFTKMRDVFIDMSRRPPLSEREWSESFDAMGRLVASEELRIRVFNGGMDPVLRREAWPHLLGVFPIDLSTEERTRFLLMKAKVYNHLKEKWLAQSPEDIQAVTHMVQRDVLRTDRAHQYFSVSNHHPNMVSLFNVLTTYALSNPDVSYCQGMSDLAAPLLVVLDDEPMAYLCFCRVMSRLKNNFLAKGGALLQKFQQLALLLMRADQKLYDYLLEIDAGNLYFCYRMLLLELKREFPFADALRVMETIWSTLPPDYGDDASEVSFYHRLYNGSCPHVNGRTSPPSEGLYVPPSQLNSSKQNGSSRLALPHPRLLNDGSPFPLFLCLAVLLLNRDSILNNMDYSVLAMFFDKMSRKQDANKVMARARSLFLEYLRAFLEGQTIGSDEEGELSMLTSHGTEASGAPC